ncbi:MAG: hypothetical protein PHU51_01505 [Candidatus Nanoarchaeia archaeon]|nr:hypothetical protein [Candidatus Nanoarchaeia archaeon]
MNEFNNEENKTNELETDKDNDSTKSTRRRISLDKVLPDYRLTKLKDHLDTIKAYAVASSNGNKPLKYLDFKGLVSFHEQKVSGLNKFLEYLGLIMSVKGKSGQYLPTKNLLDYQKQMDWEQEEDAKKILQKILVDTWFYESVKNVLLMKQKASLGELIQKLGLESGADPKTHNSSLKILVDYLKFADLINEESGEFYLVKKTEVNDEVKVTMPLPEEESKKNIDPTLTKSQNKSIDEQKKLTQSLPVNLNIHIDSNISEEKLDLIMKKIKEYCN